MTLKRLLLSLLLLQVLQSCTHLTKELGPSYIFLDNYSGRKVSIKLDNLEWQQLEDKTSRKVEVNVGDFWVTQFDLEDNKPIDSFFIKIDPSTKYVMNILGGSRYITTASFELPENGEEVLDALSPIASYSGNFFSSTANYFFEEGESLPKVIDNSKKKRTFLNRVNEDDMIPFYNKSGAYYHRALTGMKMEALDDQSRDKAFDIIMNDEVCTSYSKLEKIFENDISLVQEKCQEAQSKYQADSLIEYNVTMNKISSILLGIMPERQTPSRYNSTLKKLYQDDNLGAYFTKAKTLDTLAHNIAIAASMYSRNKKIRSDFGNEIKIDLTKGSKLALSSVHVN